MEVDQQSTIVEDYAQSLTELTFNSRPIIDNLTVIAKENTNVADGILNAVTSRIYKCIPEQKLFALYLLDSICKIVGNPYNILVGDEVFNIFSHVYLLVNDTVRQKLRNLFETWKQFKLKGSNMPLFPREQIDKVSSFLDQANASIGASGNASASTRTDQLSNTGLIEDIDKLIPVFQQKLMHNPDPELNVKFNALNQLKSILSSQTLRLQDLKPILDKLQEIKQQEFNSQASNNRPSATSPALAGPTLPKTPVVYNAKVVELFGMLVASGLIKVDQSLKPGSTPSYELNFPKQKYQSTITIPSNVALPSNSVLEQLLVSSNAKFNMSSSNIARTEFEQQKFNELSQMAVESKGLQSFVATNKLGTRAKSLLYTAKPSKCGTCGKRFTVDEDGTQKRRLHLDWHFRINKKKGSASVQSRIWYLDDYDWVKFKDETLLEFSSNDANEGSKTVESSEPEKQEIPYVTIPLTETNMNNKCLICREQIKATYNDDLGEWCWYNCIRAPGDGKNGRKIIHATCYNEANRKRSADEDLHNIIKKEKV